MSNFKKKPPIQGDKQVTKIANNEIARRDEKNNRIVNTKFFFGEPGDNAKYLTHSMMVAEMGKIDVSNPIAVRNRIYEYFELCYDHDMKPTVAGMCLAIGRARTTVLGWLAGRRESIPHEVIEVIEHAMTIINSQLEDYMQDGKINPVSGIFLAKNNFGYRDQTEFVVNNRQTEEPSADSLIEEAIFVDAEEIEK